MLEHLIFQVLFLLFSKNDWSNIKLFFIVWEKGHAGEGGDSPLEREKIKLSFS